MDRTADISTNGSGSSGLSDLEASELARLEAIVDRHLHEFIAVGSALIEIRDNSYYRATHSSFANYCRDRWDLSKSHAYRLIKSAEVAENIAGVGLIPKRESHLRPLVGLSPGDQSDAWKEASESAPRRNPPKSKAPSPARSKPAPPDPLDAEALAAAIEDDWSGPESEPEDIAAQRRAGIIPDGVAVEVVEPESPVAPADDPAPPRSADFTDAEFLAQCPARPKLNGPCLKVFDRDALFYRAVEGPRKQFHDKLRQAINANKRHLPTGNYHYFVTSFLTRKHPRHWVACDLCQGTGQEQLIGKCHNCHGSGYLA